MKYLNTHRITKLQLRNTCIATLLLFIVPGCGILWLIAVSIGWIEPISATITDSQGRRYLFVAGKQDPKRYCLSGEINDENGEFTAATKDFQNALKALPIGSGYDGKWTLLKIVSFRDQIARQDYFDELIASENGFLWPQEKMPIRVFVPQENIHGKDSEAEVNRCLSEWTAVCPDRLSFHLVHDKSQADIVFLIANEPLPPTTLGDVDGHTDQYPVKSGKFNVHTIFGARIKLARELFNGQSNYRLHRTVLHELGHALGIGGHSSNFRDIMSPSHSTDRDLPVLSSRDRQTLAHLYSQSCYNDAQRSLEREAAKGNAFAQTSLGLIYENGSEVGKDYHRSVECYKAAAGQGYAPAQKCLRVMYETGHGVATDCKQAIYWYQKAADQGFADGQLRLGLAYENGLGVKQDYSRSVDLYRKAADQGSAPAQKCLGLMYELGRGIQRDYQQAVNWYQKSADQGFADGQLRLGLAYENGLGVKRDYKQAVALYRMAADQGLASAQKCLGLMYEFGHSIRQDHKQAVYWSQKSADQRFADGQLQLGLAYENGLGVKRDYKQAVALYRMAADQGLASAQKCLGLMYEFGRGIQQDHRQAVYWYQKSADQGFADGQLRLGLAYENGLGGKIDFEKAVDLYKEAADQGNPDAQQHLKALLKRMSSHQ